MLSFISATKYTVLIICKY